MKFELLKYGVNLGSRLLGKEVGIELRQEIGLSKTIILDFEGVRFVSSSFISEVICSLYQKGIEVSYINTKELIAKQIQFALDNEKSLVH